MNSALSEDTVIEVGKSIPIKAFREFLKRQREKRCPGTNLIAG